jgi:hypothetical protein
VLLHYGGGATYCGVLHIWNRDEERYGKYFLTLMNTSQNCGQFKLRLLGQLYKDTLHIPSAGERNINSALGSPFITSESVLQRCFLLVNMSSYHLSRDQLEKYHKDGFLIVQAKEHNLVKGTDLQKWANEIYSWPKEQGKWMPYNEINEKGESQLMRTECFVDYHAGLKELLCGDGLGKVMGQLAGHVSCHFASCYCL